MEGTLESARGEWAEGFSRLQAAPPRTARSTNGCWPRSPTYSSSCVAESARRFTMPELAAAYGDADRWVLETLNDAEASSGWPARSTAVQDSAFHLFSGGAIDYQP